MALTATEFVARFPEFAMADVALVTAKLDAAARAMDLEVWGEKFDDAQGLYAARLLALSPFGQEAGLRFGAGANQRTAYDGEFERLEAMVGTAHRLVLP